MLEIFLVEDNPAGVGLMMEAFKDAKLLKMQRERPARCMQRDQASE